MKADFTPQSFESKGPTLLEFEGNTSIVIEGKTATVKDGAQFKTSEALPDHFFTMSRYIPVTVETMLVRYWLTHGRPEAIRLLPIGEASVEFRGYDTLTGICA
jgi:hypothetical protein